MQTWLVMTKSLTLARLPRAGVNSKPNHYKQKVQKMKAIPKTWVLTENNLKFSDKKKQKQYFDLSKNPVGHQDPEAIN